MTVRRFRSVWIAKMTRSKWLLVLSGLGLAGIVFALLRLRAPVPIIPSAPPDLRGVVRDESGPVADARVRIQTSNRCTLTDEDGAFRLSGDRKGRRVTAWKQGYFIGGSSLKPSLMDISLRRLPTSDHDDYEWVDPTPHPEKVQNCGNCHGQIYTEWAASAHARSANGRFFLDLYRGTDSRGHPHVGWSLVDEHPLGAGVCASCHAPAIPADDPAQLDLLELHGTAAQGVHCDYCHKIAKVESGVLGLTHGRFNLRLLRPAPNTVAAGGQIFYGPLDDVDRGEDAFSPLYSSSLYCASCHEGTVFGVPVYTTYSEWLESPARQAGKQCQTCHMQPTGTMTNFAPDHGGLERDPQTLANHRLFTGSQEEMLRKAVTVDARLEHTANEARLTLQVAAAEVGHRLPTGFVDRHLVLVVDGVGAAGKSLRAETGPVLPDYAGPELKGRPGRVYAKLLVGADAAGPAPFWRDNVRDVDNRLIPGKTDTITFTFDPALRSVRVRIIYRRFWQEVARIKGWPLDEIAIIDRTFGKFESDSR
jgi:hypothetical protein